MSAMALQVRALAFTFAFSSTSAALGGVGTVVVLGAAAGCVFAVLQEPGEPVSDLGGLLGNHVGRRLRSWSISASTSVI